MELNVQEIMLDLQKEGGVFRSFSKEAIEQTASYFAVYHYPAGSIASKPGEPLDMMGVIVSGEVILEEKTEPKGNWFVMARMTRGAILAHPSLFGAKPPPVRVIIQKDTTFLGTNGKSFDSFLKKYPETGNIFLKEMIRVLFMRYRELAARFNVAI
jgi:CRP-like cAMP-binding protein